jgi:Domain of Unknown Function (DUF748)
MKILRLKKRYKIIGGIILFLSLLLFSAPRVARGYIVKHSHQLIGRRLDIQKIRVNYFTGTLGVDSLILFEPDSRNIFLGFKRLKIRMKYLPLFRNEISVKYVTLDGPYMQVLQNGDHFNFSDLIKSDSASSKTDSVPHKTIKYIINNINISGGFVKYSDLKLNNSIALNRVDLAIPGFTWNSDSTNLGIDFRFVNGGHLFSKLDLNQADSTFTVSLKLDSLNLDIAEPYVKNNMHISSMHGYLSNDVKISGDMRNIMNLLVRGVNHIYDFQLTDTLGRPVLTFKDLTADIDTFQLANMKVRMNYLGLTNPYILFELIDSTNNWLALLKPAAEEQPDTLKKNEGAPANTVKSSFTYSRLLIRDGKLMISDKTLRYPFEYSVDRIIVESSPAGVSGRLKVNISADLKDAGAFRADAIIDPDNFNDLDLSLSIQRFRMQDVDAFFKHYFGYPVTGGRMNFSTEDKLRPGSLVSNNSLYFRKFTLGRQLDIKKEYNIPLRLALGVMSDKDGIIDLKSPVEMKGENVKVANIRKIIFHAIGNLFVKAAVSPAKLLAELFKVDPERLKEIRLSLTGASPDKKNMESVDILAEILTKKPGLSADFIYCINPEKATDTLARIMALEDYKSHLPVNAGVSDAVPDSLLTAYLISRLHADSTLVKRDLTSLCRSYIGDKNLMADIDSIRISQTDFLMNYLNHDKGIQADRFKIIATKPDSIKYEAETPSFRIYFTATEAK